jgi:hypothetical protein
MLRSSVLRKIPPFALRPSPRGVVDKFIERFLLLFRGWALATSVSFLFTKRRCLDGQEIKASRMDSGRCAHLENRRKKEDAGGKHCPNLEAIRRGYAAKGLQPGTVPGFAGLKPLKSNHQR